MSEAGRRGPGRSPFFYSGGAALAALLLYTRTLAPGLLPADSGEFQASVPLLGLAHPTGYPLYHLLGWAWVHLMPLGNMAWRLNLFSALAASLAVGGVALLVTGLSRRTLSCLEADRRHLLGFVAGLSLALIPTFWSQAIVAEVYALHALFTAVLLYLALIRLPGRSDIPEPGAGGEGSPRRDCGKYPPTPLVLTFLTLGLALTHHATTLLLVPALAVALWPHRHHLVHPAPWLALTLPLLLYAYIPWRAPHTPWLIVPLNAERPLHLYAGGGAGFLDMLTGRRFQGSFLSLPQALDRAPALLQVWRNNVPVWVDVLALGGVLALLWKRAWYVLAITLLAFGSQAVFNFFYGIGDVFVLFISLYVLVTLWFSLGLGSAAALAQRYFLARMRALGDDPQRARPIMTPTLLIVLGLLWPLDAYSAHAAGIQNTLRQQSRLAARWEAIVAAPLPEGAVIVSNDRDEMMPALYLQWVKGQRPDLLSLYPLILPDPAWDHVVDVVDQALASGRPVYTVKPMDSLNVRFQLQNTDWEIQQVAPLPPPQVVLSPPRPFDPWLTLVGYTWKAGLGEWRVYTYWRVERSLPADATAFLHVLNAAGEKVAQGNDHVPGEPYYPPAEWPVGEVVRVTHRVGGDPPGPEAVILLGWYVQSGKRLGEPIALSLVDGG